MLKQINIHAFGTNATKEKAQKDGKDPELTFTGMIPQTDINWAEPSEIDDWLESCCEAWNCLGDPKKFADRINKHLKDKLRANYHRPSGSVSVAQVMRLSPEDFLHYKELLTTDREAADEFVRSY